MSLDIQRNELHYYVDLLRMQKPDQRSPEKSNLCVMVLYDIIRTMKLSRHGKICGEDFSKLDFGSIPFNDILFSIDGELPSCFNYCILNEWNLISGNVGRMISVTFSPDGKYALTVAEDEYVIFWNVRSGLTEHKMSRFSFQKTYPTLKFNGSTAFSPNGEYNLTASKNDDTAILKNEKTGQIISILKGHTDGIRSVAFSPDGTMCLTGSYDGTAMIWETKTGTCIHKLGGNINIPQYIKIAPDSKTFLAVSYLQPLYHTSRNETQQLWDIEAEKCILTPDSTTNWNTTSKDVESIIIHINGSKTTCPAYPYEIQVNSDSFTLYKYNPDEEDDDYDLSGVKPYNIGTYYSIRGLFLNNCSFCNISATEKTRLILYQYGAIT